MNDFIRSRIKTSSPGFFRLREKNISHVEGDPIRGREKFGAEWKMKKKNVIICTAVHEEWKPGKLSSAKQMMNSRDFKY